MNKMRKCGVVLALVLATIVGFAAVAAAVEVNGAAYVQVEDNYLWRGLNFNFSEETDFLVEGGIDLYLGNFALGVWTIADNGRYISYEGDFDKKDFGIVETDIWFDYTFELSDAAWLTVGNTLYAVEGVKTTNELYLIFGYDTILSPEFAIYYDWDEDAYLELDGIEDGDGLYYELNVSHGVDLSDAAALTLGATISYNQGSWQVDPTYNDFHHYELNAALDWAVTDQIIITPMLRYSDALGSDADDAGVEDETAVQLAATLEW